MFHAVDVSGSNNLPPIVDPLGGPTFVRLIMPGARVQPGRHLPVVPDHPAKPQ